ncbi:MAG: CvpA family protein [Alphaproteobacteria bacterium]|nr:CvpA family protein [Alphaproteobacteria bacterium]
MTPIMLDTAIIIVILLSVIVAFFRGFVKEVLTIVNLLGAAVAAWYLGGQFAPQFQKWMGAGQKVADGEKAHKVLGLVTPEVAGTFLSYFTVFFVTLIILGLAGMAIAASVKAMGLGPLDKVLGMVFGALRGFLLVLLIYVPFAYFMPPDKKKYPDWVEESMSFVALDASYNWLEKYLGEKKEELAEQADGEKPDGPFTRRLKKMEDDLLRKQSQPEEAPYEDVTDDVHSEILSDDESHNPR